MLRVGYHEEHMRVWDGENWSVGWADSTDPLSAAVATFSCGKQIIVPSVLAGDLEGKGIIKITKPAPAAKKPAVASQQDTIWEGNSEAWGRLQVVNKIDSTKNKFSALVHKGGQLTQVSAKSVKYNLKFGDKIMAAVGKKVIEDNIQTKPEVVACRDKVRLEYQKELEDLPEGQPAEVAAEAKASDEVRPRAEAAVPTEAKHPAVLQFLLRLNLLQLQPRLNLLQFQLERLAAKLHSHPSLVQPLGLVQLLQPRVALHQARPSLSMQVPKLFFAQARWILVKKFSLARFFLLAQVAFRVLDLRRWLQESDANQRRQVQNPRPQIY